jgi:hypothetical protein
MIGNQSVPAMSYVLKILQFVDHRGRLEEDQPDTQYCMMFHDRQASCWSILLLWQVAVVLHIQMRALPQDSRCCSSRVAGIQNSTPMTQQAPRWAMLLSWS